MIFQDDRTPEQKKTPHLIVLGTDRFLSGWGKAEGGKSYAGWAVPVGQVDKMEQRIRGRSDMQRVRVVGANYRPPAGPGHCHIYASAFSEEM